MQLYSGNFMEYFIARYLLETRGAAVAPAALAGGSVGSRTLLVRWGVVWARAERAAAGAPHISTPVRLQ